MGCDPQQSDFDLGPEYKGFSVAIVTAAGQTFARLLLDFCRSLGGWARVLGVIDIGLGKATLKALRATNVELMKLPPDFFAAVRLKRLVGIGS